MFKDRNDAGLKLAKELSPYKKHKEDTIVLAIPRGGLPLGAIVAKALDAPLDVALTKKIGHPYNREYAIGAVSLGNVVLNKAVGVTKSYIEEETARIREKLQKRHKRGNGTGTHADLKFEIRNSKFEIKLLDPVNPVSLIPWILDELY